MSEDVRWIGRALAQRATVDCNYAGLHRARRWWYTAKAIICILVRSEDNRTWRERPVLEPDDVEVAYGNWSKTYHPEFGEGASGDVLGVGNGYFRNWFFTIRWTGYP